MVELRLGDLAGDGLVGYAVSSESQNLEVAEAIKVAILGQQPSDARFATERDDLRVEDEISESFCFLRRCHEKTDKALAGLEHEQARGSQHALEGLACLVNGERRIEDAAVRYDAEKLSETEHWDRPAFIVLCEVAEPLLRRSMLWQLFPMRVDQDVGVDGDHSRPSMRS